MLLSYWCFFTLLITFVWIVARLCWQSLRSCCRRRFEIVCNASTFWFLATLATSLTSHRICRRCCCRRCSRWRLIRVWPLLTRSRTAHCGVNQLRRSSLSCKSNHKSNTKKVIIVNESSLAYLTEYHARHKFTWAAKKSSSSSLSPSTSTPKPAALLSIATSAVSCRSETTGMGGALVTMPVPSTVKLPVTSIILSFTLALRRNYYYFWKKKRQT